MPEKSPYEHDKAMEVEAQKIGAYPVKDVVTQVHQKIGLFNMIRNRKNKMEIEVSKADEPK